MINGPDFWNVLGILFLSIMGLVALCIAVLDLIDLFKK